MYGTPLFFFFFNDTATTEIYTLSLHDALPISRYGAGGRRGGQRGRHGARRHARHRAVFTEQPAEADDHRVREQLRSEEHTSELQSPCNLVCRLLLEKKKKND